MEPGGSEAVRIAKGLNYTSLRGTRFEQGQTLHQAGADAEGAPNLQRPVRELKDPLKRPHAVYQCSEHGD
jgi:hypothetical protein